MQLLGYIIVYPLLLLVSILPFRLLYMVSDIVYLLIFYVIGYRRKTVRENLTLVFPEKPITEIKQIEKKFYKHMCDMFLEMIKSMSASKKEIAKRFVITNPEEFKRLESLDKSIITMFGHYASYEWSMVVENYINFKGYGVYKKIKNDYFDALVRRIRSKYNTTLITTKETRQVMTDLNRKGEKYMIGFLSDQSPKYYTNNHWATFMNIKVPTFVGAEVLAKKLDMTVIYLKISKVKRGYYEAEVMTLTENPKAKENFEITDLFLEQLEDQIKAAPEYYLWTHKRWKHRNKAPKA